MGNSFNNFIDNLISVFNRFLELPFFVIFLGALALVFSLQIALKYIFKKRINSKTRVRITLILLIVVSLIFFDKKISLLKSEVNVLHEKVLNFSQGSTNVVIENKIKIEEDAILNIFPDASVFIKPLNEAMSMISFKKDNPLARVYIAVIDLTHPKLEIKMDDSIQHKTLTSGFAKKYNCEVAINGEAGETAELGAELGEWTGNYFVKGKVILQQDSELRPFLSFNRNNKGAYYKANLVDTIYNKERYNTIWGRFDVLVDNEVVADLNPRSYTRTVMGINDAGDILYLMIADGKRPSYSMGLSYEECGKLMKSLGAKNAMACDQGGSTAMYVKSVNGLINRPADSDGNERVVYTHFGVSLF